MYYVLILLLSWIKHLCAERSSIGLHTRFIRCINTAGVLVSPNAVFSTTVAKIKSIRVMFAMAVFDGFEVWQMEVKTAFLIGKLAEDVYMNQPEGFVDAKYSLYHKYIYCGNISSNDLNPLLR